MKESLRQAVWQRARGICEYCQLSANYSEFEFEVDHVIAEKHGGLTVHENLCLAYFYCNSYKGPNVAGVDPRSGQVVALFNHRKQTWNRHFEWDGPTLSGKTRAGRATIEVLSINAEFAVAVRQSLIEEGVFPPMLLPH